MHDALGRKVYFDSEQIAIIRPLAEGEAADGLHAAVVTGGGTTTYIAETPEQASSIAHDAGR